MITAPADALVLVEYLRRRFLRAAAVQPFIPSDVLAEMRQERAERIRQAASTLVGQAKQEAEAAP
jgi:hypothetical protein